MSDSFLEVLSRAGGIVSIAIWIVALLPQVILNLRRRSASGLAFGLLVLWLVGDTAGVAGAFMTNQLVFQRLIAVWHWVIDAVLLAQWIFYHSQDDQRIIIEDKRDRQVQREEQHIQHRKLSIDQAYSYRDREGLITPMARSRDRPSFSGPRGVLIPPRLARTKSERRPERRRGRRTWSYIGAAVLLVLFIVAMALLSARTNLLDHVLPHGKTKRRLVQRLGIVSAWLCAALYLGSRIPQLYHNHTRKSVYGLSISLFVLGLAANFFYISSVLITPRARLDAGWNSKYLLHALPYLVTAGGASLLDCFICAQWLHYRKAGWEDVDPRDRLEPGLARREALEAAGVVFSDDTPDHSRTPSVSINERTPLWTPA